MKVINDINEIEFDKKSAITVGTFDGVHRGHKAIIDKLVSIKNAKGLRSVLITFEPHPQVVLRNRTKDIKILSTLEEKLKLLKGYDIDYVYVIKFTKDFANTRAEDFYKNYLIDKIGLSDLVLGYDHMFGKNREGNLDTLKSLSEKYDFSVDKVEEFKVNSEHISSTVIRHLLEEGNVSKAANILGRNYSLEGTIEKGKGLGKELGYPTANVKPDSEFKLIPKTGIYAAEAEIDGLKHYGMLSVGKNPTVSNDDLIKIEINLFDFDEDIYGKNISISFIDYIRDEKKFDSLDELKKEMNEDKHKSLKLITNNKQTYNAVN